MNTSGVNPTHSQRFSHSPPVTGSGSAQASPVDALCATYRDALENLASPLCQNLLVDSCMERRLRIEEGGFLESHEVSQVQQQSDAVQKMETLLSILRTKDDQAFRGFIEWLCDSDSSRSWGQALAEQAGLSGAAVSGQRGGHLERRALRRRALGEVPVIQVPPGPNRLGAEASGADPADAAVRREGRCKILCRQVIELTSIATIATGWFCGTVCGSLPGLFVAGKAIELMVSIPPEYDEHPLLDVGWVGLLIGGALAMGLAMVGGRIGMVMGEGIGIAMGEVIDRGISGLLGRPVLPRLNERDMMAFDPRQQEPRRQEPRQQEPRQQGCFLLDLFGGRGPQQELRRDGEAPA